MDRRGFLTGIGSVAIAGCTGSSNRGNTQSPSSKGEPTVKPEKTVKATEVLSFGEWWEGRLYAYRVDSITEATTYRDTLRGEDGEMPSDQSLLFVDISVKNISNEPQYGPSPSRFAVIVDGDLFVAYNAELPISEKYFERISDDQLMGGANGMNSGVTKLYRLVSAVPRSVSKSNVSIGYDTYSSEAKYEIQWRSK